MNDMCGIDTTPSGLNLHESTTQGWQRKAPPTLGSEMLPFQGSYEFRKLNLDKLGLQPRHFPIMIDISQSSGLKPNHMFVLRPRLYGLVSILSKQRD